jgi:Regulator of chromosome condensation (RCC1) repeat
MTTSSSSSILRALVPDRAFFFSVQGALGLDASGGTIVFSESAMDTLTDASGSAMATDSYAIYHEASRPSMSSWRYTVSLNSGSTTSALGTIQGYSSEELFLSFRSKNGTVPVVIRFGDNVNSSTFPSLITGVREMFFGANNYADSAQRGALITPSGSLIMWGRVQSGTVQQLNMTARGTLRGTKAVTVATNVGATLVTDVSGRIHYSYSTDTPLLMTSGSLAGKYVVSVAVATGTGYAIDSSGQLHYWGSSTVILPASATPRLLDFGSLAGKRVSSVSGGHNFAMALDTDGVLHAMGLNFKGMLGQGTAGSLTDYYTSPVTISGVLAGKRVVQVACGGEHSLALDASGTVYGWGSSSNGECASGASSVVTPISIASGSLSGRPAVSVSAGFLFSLALDYLGHVHAWGVNASNKLGIGSTNATLIQRTPVLLRNGAFTAFPVKSIKACNNQAYVLDAMNIMYAWGNNAFYQLGSSGVLTASSYAVPTLVDPVGIVYDQYRPASSNDGGALSSTFVARGAAAEALLPLWGTVYTASGLYMEKRAAVLWAVTPSSTVAPPLAVENAHIRNQHAGGHYVSLKPTRLLTSRSVSGADDDQLEWRVLVYDGLSGPYFSDRYVGRVASEGFPLYDRSAFVQVYQETDQAITWYGDTRFEVRCKPAPSPIF